MITEPTEAEVSAAHWAQEELTAFQHIRDLVEAAGVLKEQISPLEDSLEPIRAQLKQWIELNPERLDAGRLYSSEKTYYAHLQGSGRGATIDLKRLYHEEGGPLVLRELLELGMLRLDLTMFKQFAKATPSAMTERVNKAIIPGGGTSLYIERADKS